jgi:hypothetical protein
MVTLKGVWDDLHCRVVFHNWPTLPPAGREILASLIYVFTPFYFQNSAPPGPLLKTVGGCSPPMVHGWICLLLHFGKAVMMNFITEGPKPTIRLQTHYPASSSF